MIKRFLVGTGVMLGTIIGAGFLALPYAAAQAGLRTVLIFLAVLALIVTLLHLAYADVVVSTPQKHRLPGYAAYYFGPEAKRIAGVSVLVGGLGGLLLYLIFGGAFISLLFPKNEILIGTLIFWAILTFLLFLRFSMSSLVDAAASWFLVGMLITLTAISLKNFVPANLVLEKSPASWFLPYGIVMFSLLGLAAIPEIATIESINSRQILARVITLSTSGAALLYAIFTWAVLGAIGPKVSPNAFLDIFKILPEWGRWILPFVGLVAIGTSYFTFGYMVRKTLELDFGFSPGSAFLVVAIVPILLFLLGLKDIIRIIGFLGGIWVSVDAALVLLMQERANSQTKQGFWQYSFINRLLIIFFILGTISSIVASR